MCALYGLNRDDFNGAYDAWRAALHPDDVEAATQAIQKACPPWVSTKGCVTRWRSS